LLAELEEAGFVGARLLEDRKRTVIDLTPAGFTALQHPSALEPLGRPRVELVRAAGPEGDPDEALFQALRAWRLEEARSHEVPPYVVFQDTVLRAIASQRPRTLEALDEIKGIGPAKLERYGAAVIGLVRAHVRNARGDASP
jgi:superfamily II DNA helicase RecQ